LKKGGKTKIRRAARKEGWGLSKRWYGKGVKPGSSTREMW